LTKKETRGAQLRPTAVDEPPKADDTAASWRHLMDNRIPPFRPDVVAAQSAPRPTPKTSNVNFSAVLTRGAKGLVAGAEAALNVLPGGPLMAVAIRGGAGGVGGSTTPMMSGPMGGAQRGATAEGPGVSGSNTGAGGTGTPTDGGIENSLQQSQEMNMYYLQIQEQVNAQNRTFSALSNVLKAEHDTVKTAIGNIR
jgi:hypothetical protein